MFKNFIVFSNTFQIQISYLFNHKKHTYIYQFEFKMNHYLLMEEIKWKHLFPYILQTILLCF